MDITITLTDEQANAIIVKQGGLEYIQTYVEMFANTLVEQCKDDLRSSVINNARETLTHEQVEFLNQVQQQEGGLGALIDSVRNK